MLVRKLPVSEAFRQLRRRRQLVSREPPPQH